GIYLPDNVRGKVTVRASVIMAGCKIGQADPGTVDVNPGGVASLSVRVKKIDNPGCPMMMVSPKGDGGDGPTGDVAEDRGGDSGRDGGTDSGEDRTVDAGREQAAEAGEDLSPPKDTGSDLGATVDAGMEHATGHDAEAEHECDPD